MTLSAAWSGNYRWAVVTARARQVESGDVGEAVPKYGYDINRSGMLDGTPGLEQECGLDDFGHLDRLRMAIRPNVDDPFICHWAKYLLANGPKLNFF